MRIAFILHDFSLTGAPRLGLQIAERFCTLHDVTLITKKDGPLREMVAASSFCDVIDSATNHEICDLSLEARIESAVSCLSEVKPDLVYVNSIAASDWVGAAKRFGCACVLHIHEMRRMIIDLQKLGIFAGSDIRQVDHVLAASEECLRDFQDIFHIPKGRVSNFGVCVDIDDIRARAAEMPPLAIRHDSIALDFSASRSKGQRIVAMCGLACNRKGSDIFWRAAMEMPEIDFLWVGPWNDEIAVSFNPALELNEQRPLDNLYWTNMVTNPYAALAAVDLFILTAREDPNPLVVPEAIAVGTPVATFAATGGSHHWTSRFGFSLSGEVSVDRIVEFIRRSFSSTWGRTHPDPTFHSVADLKLKTADLMKQIEQVREAASGRQLEPENAHAR